MKVNKLMALQPLGTFNKTFMQSLRHSEPLKTTFSCCKVGNLKP